MVSRNGGTKHFWSTSRGPMHAALFDLLKILVVHLRSTAAPTVQGARAAEETLTFHLPVRGSSKGGRSVLRVRSHGQREQELCQCHPAWIDVKQSEGLVKHAREGRAIAGARHARIDGCSPTCERRAESVHLRHTTGMHSGERPRVNRVNTQVCIVAQESNHKACAWRWQKAQ